MATKLNKTRRKASKSTHVYCFQLGDADCFKIGKSVDPGKRKGDFSTASPVELIERRREPTEHPEALEKYIHETAGGEKSNQPSRGIQRHHAGSDKGF